MKKLLTVYKPLGLTPYQTIQKLRAKYPEYKDETIGFAGRLDPLAHGVLLLMVGEATKERDKYLNLPKEYEFEAVFGMETDTYDMLGLLKNLQVKPLPPDATSLIQAFLHAKQGMQTQQYPPFSSKTVHGKPLFWWAKNNKLSEITIPKRNIEISQFSLLAMEPLSAEQLHMRIKKNISLVEGHFRQAEILERWEMFFTKHPKVLFQTARFKIHCSSGTYVRGLVHELGNKLGCRALTLEILRTKVGEYSLRNIIHI